MIVTRSWLNEWVDLTNVNSQDILDTLNSIGLEVGSFKSYKVPKQVVVGYVKSAQKHENSDHLSVCQVDVGSETLQIVCGAPNVQAGQYVAVSLVGAQLPSGIIIKKAKLRGVESCGMICSCAELGLVKLNDGIMVLDDSIGKLELGRELCEFPRLNDDVIEIDLTPNRGDCLSVHGVARDLGAALDIALKEHTYDEAEGLLGIGRVLSIHADEKLECSFQYRAFEIKSPLKTNLLTQLRLAFVEDSGKNSVEELLKYVTHSTGVLLRAYDYFKICADCERLNLDVLKQENGEYGVFFENKILSIAGILQTEDFKVDEETKIVIVEANYTNPLVISNAIGSNKELKSDEHLYRSSRGSEPELSLGGDYLFDILKNDKHIKLYGGYQQAVPHKDHKMVSISTNELNKMIGVNVERNEVVKILKRLCFDVSLEGELINIKVPFFRHDIENSHDICEEIVRNIGINNIPSVALVFGEKNRLNSEFTRYENSKNLRYKAANVGFFECVHYVFDDKKSLDELGFKPCLVEILNPINNELNTLRPTLINHLLCSAERNFKNSKRAIKLFEFGEVFDVNSTQSSKFAFIASGLKSEPTLNFGAKAQSVDFIYFASLIQSLIGKFQLKLSSDKFEFLSPFEQADIWQNGEKIGYIGRVNLNVEIMRDLPKSYVCEIDFSKLKFDRVIAHEYSKFQSSTRDLSIVVQDNIEYAKIKECISSLNIADLREFLPIDIYRDLSLKDCYSLTIKFTFQNREKTLEDDEISAIMESILSALKDKIGITLR